MAAGLGFKTFTTGEVLTSADVNGYLMQGILVFANATARDAAITAPQEGQFAYLKDTNVTTYYTGSAWANVDTTGMTNPMTTTGDIIYSSTGSTPARLGIGTAGQVLKVNSGATAPEWGTVAAGGGKVLQVLSTTKTDTFTTTSTSFADVTGLSVSITPSLATSKVLVLFNIAASQAVGSQLAYTRLMRDSTAISVGNAAGNRAPGSGDANSVANSISTNAASGSYLDNPATTSALTYKFQVKTSGGTMFVNRSDDDSDAATRSRTASTITVMEIGA